MFKEIESVVFFFSYLVQLLSTDILLALLVEKIYIIYMTLMNNINEESFVCAL